MTSKIRALEHLAEDLRENGYAMQSDTIHALIAERDAAIARAEAAEAGNLSKVPVGEWQECLEPIIARFEVTGALGDDFTAVYNSKGSAALGKLFRKMSQTLDAAVDALGRAERAEAEAERLREALAFYACRDNWRQLSVKRFREERPDEDPTISIRGGGLRLQAPPGFCLSPIDLDRSGSRARAALEGCDNSGSANEKAPHDR